MWKTVINIWGKILLNSLWEKFGKYPEKILRKNLGKIGKKFVGENLDKSVKYTENYVILSNKK